MTEDLRATVIGANVRIEGRIFTIGALTIDRGERVQQILLTDELGRRLVVSPKEFSRLNPAFGMRIPVRAQLELLAVSAGDDPESLRELRRAHRQSASSMPLRFLNWWSALLPQRIVSEDLADYLEDIHRRLARGEKWLVYVRVLAAMFWTGVNAIGYLRKQISEKTSAG